MVSARTAISFRCPVSFSRLILRNLGIFCSSQWAAVSVCGGGGPHPAAAGSGGQREPRARPGAHRLIIWNTLVYLIFSDNLAGRKDVLCIWWGMTDDRVVHVSEDHRLEQLQGDWPARLGEAGWRSTALRAGGTGQACGGQTAVADEELVRVRRFSGLWAGARMTPRDGLLSRPELRGARPGVGWTKRRVLDLGTRPPRQVIQRVRRMIKMNLLTGLTHQVRLVP